MDRHVPLCLLCMILGLGLANAQPPVNTLRDVPPPTTANPTPQSNDEESTQPQSSRKRLSKEDINTRLSRIEQLPEDIRPQMTELLQQALLAAVEVDNQAAKLQEWQTQRERFKTAEEYKTLLAQPIEELRDDPSIVAPHDFANDPIDELEQVITKWTALVATRRNELTDYEALPERRRVRTAQIPPLVNELQAKLTEAEAKLAEIAGAGAPSELDVARRILLEEQVAQFATTIDALRAELEFYQSTQNLVSLARQWCEVRLKVRELVLGELQDVVNNRKRRDAERQARQAEDQARSQVISRVDVLKQIATENQEFTAEKLKLLELEKQVVVQAARDAKQKSDLEASLKQVRQWFENSSVSQTGGQLLRSRRAQLPNLAALNRELALRQTQQNDVQFRNYAIVDRRAQLNELEVALQEQLAKVPPGDRPQAEPLLRSLLESQQTFLDELVAGYEEYSRDLATLIANKESLQRVAQDFSDFIAERDLWIRSCEPLGMGSSGSAASPTAKHPVLRDLQLTIDAALWTFDPRNWVTVGLDLQQSMQRQPFASLVLLTAIGSLLFVQRRARRDLTQLGELASKRTTIEFKPSLRAAWLTLVVALPWPLLMWSVGYLLNNPGIESEFTRSFAVGLRFAAALLFFAELLRQSYRSRGLADAHFEWPEACIAQVRRYLRLFPWTLLPVVLWIVGLEVQSTQPFWAASLGRLLFILVMVLLTLVLWRVLLSSASPLLQIIKRSASGFFMNLHRLWRPLLVALPLGLAGLAAAGYYYTAQQLAVRGIWTAAMIAGLMLVGGLLQRWVLLSRRKLAREQARQKRAAAQAAAAAAAEAALQAGEAPPSMSELPEETVDLGALSEQTRKLVNTSLQFVGVVAVFIIWRDVFPALLRLDSSPLPLVNTPNIDNPTTWGHLLRFVVASAVTFAAVRDLPSVLELAVLQQFSIDPGVRYAITALVRYALLGLGIIAAAAALGITATSISWLVAALGVGLGFGLQEIFANFVSGIILLFERPIRVGDIITLGDKTGIVTRIRIRATTIVDWDRKEYIVPNKDLVTERLLNWTLTDQTNRIVIEIGVAYGSDTELAVQTLRKICEDHPRVLADPGPVVTFEGFGDSTLNLVLRCFLASLEFRLQTIHELHTTIDREFRALNIEIAFPQRDIHVRSLPSTLLSPNSASASAAATTTSNAADNR